MGRHLPTRWPVVERAAAENGNRFQQGKHVGWSGLARPWMKKTKLATEEIQTAESSHSSRRDFRVGHFPRSRYQVSRWRGGRFAWRTERPFLGRRPMSLLRTTHCGNIEPCLCRPRLGSSLPPANRYESTKTPFHVHSWSRPPQAPTAPLKRLYRK